MIPGIPLAPEEMEAKEALMALFRAEEIKMADEDFLERIGDQISKKRDMLDRIEEALGTSQSPDSMKSFLERLKADKREQEFREKESPIERRLRLAQGKKDKVVNGVLLTKFT